MRGLAATVTSCIGGKDEKFAVQVKPATEQLYFVYKTMSDFETLFGSLEAIVAETTNSNENATMVAKWLTSFVKHYAFPSIIHELRAQNKETATTLNAFLQLVVRRASALYVENTILRCGCCQVGRRLAKLVRNFLEFAPKEVTKTDRKRQFSETRPEDCDNRQQTRPVSTPMFPMRTGSGMAGDRSPKARKLSGVNEFCVPSLRKVDLDIRVMAPVTSRRRVFAEVDFNI